MLKRVLGGIAVILGGRRAAAVDPAEVLLS